MLLLALALASSSLSGTWQSPLGPLHITEERGAVTAVVVGDNACGFKRGVVVFDGARLDGVTVAGTATGCRTVKPGCPAGPVTGDAILVVDAVGKTIKGAVHLALGACTGPVTTTLQWAKAKAKTPALTTTKAAKTQALALLAEAAPLLTRTGDVEVARARCLEALALDPGLALAHNCVGVSFYFRGRFADAMVSYNESLEIDPAIGDTYYNIACLYSRKQPDIAMRYLTLAVANGFISKTTQQAWATDGDLDPLRARADFIALVKTASP